MVGHLHEAFDAEVAFFDTPLHQVKRARDHAQHIVEVVRDPASELTDRFHFLRLPKLAFDLLALAHLRQQVVVRDHELIARSRELKEGASSEITDKRAHNANQKEGARRTDL